MGMIEYIARLFQGQPKPEESSFEIPFYKTEQLEALDKPTQRYSAGEHAFLDELIANTTDPEKKYDLWVRKIYRGGLNLDGLENRDLYLTRLETLGRCVRYCGNSEEIPFYTRDQIEELFGLYESSSKTPGIKTPSEQTDEELHEELQSIKRLSDGARGMIISFVHRNQEYIDMYGNERDTPGGLATVEKLVLMLLVMRDVVYMKYSITSELNKRHPITAEDIRRVYE